MPQSRQTPGVWSDAIRGSEILSNWVKLGASAVLLWFSIGIALGALVGGLWFLAELSGFASFFGLSRSVTRWFV
jgi:hypothetical protein